MYITLCAFPEGVRNIAYIQTCKPTYLDFRGVKKAVQHLFC